MKIVIINHTFQQKQFSKRWKVLASQHPDWDVTLLAPSEFGWRNSNGLTTTAAKVTSGYEIDDGNYHVKMIKIKNGNSRLGLSWTSSELIDYIDQYKPDIVYHIGGSVPEALIQILKYKKRKNRKLKVFTFSMRGPTSERKNLFVLQKQDKSLLKKILRYPEYFYLLYKSKILNKYCDAVFCHYPEGMESFRREGYKGPIFMQTQVGVDTEVFYPDHDKRKQIRDKLGLGDSFVFASAVRFIDGKGVIQMLEALPVNGNWKYLLMGSGSEQEVRNIKNKIKERKIEDRVILPGFIEWEEMASYWNAVDCCIHFTQSTPQWVETFSLTLVQAMATKLPVVGSSSGSVPYQLGPDGIIVQEKDINGLHEKLQWVIDHQEEAKEIGQKLYTRTVNSFSITHLNNLFYATVEDLLDGIYDPEKIDMTNTCVK